MKINYLMILGVVIVLSCSYAIAVPQGRWTSEWSRGADTSGAVPIIIGFLLVMCIIIVIFFYFAHSYSQRVHDRYDRELERLDKQLKDKQISEETYRELKRDIERKYKRYT